MGVRFRFACSGGVFLCAEELFAVVEVALQQIAQIVLPDGAGGQVPQPGVQGEDGGGDGSGQVVQGAVLRRRQELALEEAGWI